MNDQECIAFEGSRRIAAGPIAQVAAAAKPIVDAAGAAPVLIFSIPESRLVEIDFRGTVDDVVRRLTAAPPAADAQPKGPGRPRLGVVAREVTLLPRHWEWLNRQPGGASVALRKLVEAARRENAGQDEVRESRECAYRFMSAMAGNETGFEEAARALFGGNRAGFEQMTRTWPEGVRAHALRLAEASFSTPSEI